MGAAPVPGRWIAWSDSLIGEPVVNGRDEGLGTLAHLMFDARTGRIAYAVVARGGVLGLGEKLHAIPWAALALDRVRRCFVVDLDVARLEASRGFDRASWAISSDSDWERAATRLFEAHGSACSRGEKHHPA